MKSHPGTGKNPRPWRQIVRSDLCAIAISLIISHAQAASNVVIWDTGRRFGGTLDGSDRSNWQAVPAELFGFEADPAKAASDPGYYGREYAFEGDAVVENSRLIAVFWSAPGRVVLYAKARNEASVVPGGAAPGSLGLGSKVLEISLAPVESQRGAISQFEIVRNVCDEAVLRVSFSEQGSPACDAVFSFGKDEILEIKPGSLAGAVHLRSPVEYGVVPGFVADDLIIGRNEPDLSGGLTVPAQNVFVGLLKGEGHELVLTWPEGKQRLTLRRGNGASASGVFGSMEFHPDGKAFYVTAMSAPGIWHREELKPAYLEKEVSLSWQRPFSARWKTQLMEAGVRTTFTFRDAKAQIWRGVPGSYQYPAWFDGDRACYHLSKKVPPKGESIIYFLEGQNTPLSMMTPVDVMKTTLGRRFCDGILDAAGRKLRTHHRRGANGVHRACTCGCTEAIQDVFEAGEEVERKEFVKEALDDMNFFVRCHLERIEEYTQFAKELTSVLRAQAAAAPELQSFCANLEPVVEQIPEAYRVQKENMKSLDHARDLSRRTMGLTNRKDPGNLKAYMDLLDAWRAMGGAQDFVLAQCHAITRDLFQKAGYGCLDNPAALHVAHEVRHRCRQVLRNPDGYEIWANY